MSLWDSIPPSRSAELIQRRIANGSAAQSWLLLGGRGSPLFDVAIAMAASFVCKAEPGQGCGTCVDCKRILKRGHPDVHHIVPEGAFIRVETIRESVIPEVARSPFEASMKVFVIEAADRMNPSAQNALLKTLEEPPADCVLILISEREDEILDTIQSRCLITRFEALSSTAIAEMLERAGTEAELARLAVRVAPNDLARARDIAGDEAARLRRALWLSIPGRLANPADALELAAEVVTEVRDAVREREREHKEEIAEIMSTIGDARGTGTIKTMLANRYKRTLKRVEETLMTEVLETLASFYRDVLAVQSGALSSIANIDKEEQLAIWAASSSTTAAGLVGMVDHCADSASALSKNANVTLTMEALLLEALRLVPPPPLGEVARA